MHNDSNVRPHLGVILEGIRVCGFNNNLRLARQIGDMYRIGRRDFNEHFDLGQRQRAEQQGAARA